MKTLLIILAIIAVLVVAVMITFFVMGKNSRNISMAGLENGTLQSCPDRPSCVSSLENRKAFQIAPLVVDSSIKAPLQKLEQLIMTMPQANIIERRDTYLHATFTSKFFGFVDDIEFLCDGSNTIQVRSVSRVGHSDLGVNRQRVEAIRAKL